MRSRYTTATWTPANCGPPTWGEKFDATGTLIHEPTRLVLAKFLADFEQWIATLK